MPVLPVPTRRFPGLQTALLSRRRVYFDNACLTPVPAEVADAVKEYYTQPPGCPLRNNSGRSGDVEERIRDARDSVRRFLNAKFSDEIIFTPNTTFGINLLAGAFLRQPGRVLISDLEHNSNRLPWLAHQRLELAWPPGQPFPLDAYRRGLGDGVKLVSITAMSNVTGEAPPLREIVKEAAVRGIPVHLDAAQAFASGELDVTELGPGLRLLLAPQGLRPDRTRRAVHETGLASSPGPRLRRRRHGQRSLGRDVSLDGRGATLRVRASELRGNSRSAGGDDPACRHSPRRSPPALRRTERRTSGRPEPGSGTPDCRSPESRRCASYLFLPSPWCRRPPPFGNLDMVGNFQVRAGRLCAHHWFHQHRVPDVIRVSFGIHNSLDEVEAYGKVFDNILRHYD